METAEQIQYCKKIHEEFGVFVVHLLLNADPNAKFEDVVNEFLKGKKQYEEWIKS